MAVEILAQSENTPETRSSTLAELSILYSKKAIAEAQN